MRVVNLESGKQVAQGRTYTRSTSNPKAFTVEPGRYKVEIKAVKLPGTPSQSFEAAVKVEDSVEKNAEF